MSLKGFSGIEKEKEVSLPHYHPPFLPQPHKSSLAFLKLNIFPSTSLSSFITHSKSFLNYGKANHILSFQLEYLSVDVSGDAFPLNLLGSLLNSPSPPLLVFLIHLHRYQSKLLSSPFSVLSLP